MFVRRVLLIDERGLNQTQLQISNDCKLTKFVGFDANIINKQRRKTQKDDGPK
jgi:hypothetical protein